MSVESDVEKSYLNGRDAERASIIKDLRIIGHGDIADALEECHLFRYDYQGSRSPYMRGRVDERKDIISWLVRINKGPIAKHYREKLGKYQRNENKKNKAADG